jgi:hypothetical protein
LGAGLPLVLFCLFFCLHRQCKKESGPILKESLTSPLQILEEKVPNGNQRISLVEMDEISLYESINENQVLSNLSLAMQSNGETVSCRLKRSQSTSSEIADFQLFHRCRHLMSIHDPINSQHLLPEVLMMYFERLQDHFFFELLW